MRARATIFCLVLVASELALQQMGGEAGGITIFGFGTSPAISFRTTQV
jgi:hypothetical protein